MSAHNPAASDTAKKIRREAARLGAYINRRPWNALGLISELYDDTGSLGFSVEQLADANLQRACTTPYRNSFRSKLEFIAMDVMELLFHYGVEDFGEVFVAEYERAASKHPGMTLDADGHTDETRFYALAEEVGEVAASLTYDNDNSTGHGADTIAEATQVGALALAWLARYQDREER
jgi:hypothetical protein|uniref:Uncharacterized protein n=1 Tax=Siphoviridae sp. ctUWs1 TaxID=2826352 RepID=A0A8S5QV85_9CAUD|nr:MAG TPA: hypothetical protein [Siphoviridae sp. ctUWs1]